MGGGKTVTYAANIGYGTIGRRGGLILEGLGGARRITTGPAISRFLSRGRRSTSDIYVVWDD